MRGVRPQGDDWRADCQWLAASIGNKTTVGGNLCQSDCAHCTLLLKKRGATVFINCLNQYEPTNQQATQGE